MERISIKKLNYLYNKFHQEEQKPCNHKNEKFNYLNLSVHFSRDQRDFDKSNYKLLSFITSQKKINQNISINNKEEISVFRKYLLSFKEYYYLPSARLPLTFLIDIFKFGRQIIDVIGIILIISTSKLIDFIVNFKNKKINYRKQKIYSIYYWKQKKSKSATYYYPGINYTNQDLVFISSFADSKFFSFGLIHSKINTDFLSPEKILNIGGLFKSILQLIHLFLYDLLKPIYDKNCSFLTFWIGWKKTAEIFYSILTYNSLRFINRKSKNCEFISWHENQITNRSFALGASYVIRKKSSNTLTTFNGSLFTQNIKRQFLPSWSEYKIGFFGEKYYLQDEGSLKEMISYLKKHNINIPLEVVARPMIRTQINLENKKRKIKVSRDITIFTHSTYWDLIACVLSIFNNKNKILKNPKLVNKKKKIFIRLHPALTKLKALEEIKKIDEIKQDSIFEFIDNNKESFYTSLSLCKYSIFGESSYINLALEREYSVFAVNTNHINQSPIKSELINSPNLSFISPW